MLSRNLTKVYFNDDFGVFRCIAHKEKVVTELFDPWIINHPEFNYEYVITINESISTLNMLISDQKEELKEFKEKYDSEGSSGINKTNS